jgi:UDP-3-O-[3-hydroxymyristoyl] N-acetylglucosamine deacetylase
MFEYLSSVDIEQTTNVANHVIRLIEWRPDNLNWSLDIPNVERELISRIIEEIQNEEKLLLEQLTVPIADKYIVELSGIVFNHVSNTLSEIDQMLGKVILDKWKQESVETKSIDKQANVYASTKPIPTKYSLADEPQRRERLRHLPLSRQTTISHSVEISGKGLHTAALVHLRLNPAPPDTGYVFVRIDLDGFEIPATVANIAHSSYTMTLMHSGVMISSVENLLAALRGLSVDNCYIEVDNLELPIMDGSVEPFTEMIERAKISMQAATRRALLIRERIEVEYGNRRISVEPHEGWTIDCTIDFNHPLIGIQHLLFDVFDTDAFVREISPARTFGFTEESEALRRANLIHGGSLDNAIVLTPDGMLNETSLRFPDEFVRNKINNIIGDFALLGLPLLGLVRAERSGHVLHAALMSKLLQNDSAWDVVDIPTESGAFEGVSLSSK